MIKVFIPSIKGKEKTSVRGFWRDEAGQIYYDYLKLEVYNTISEDYLLKEVDYLKVKYNQEALFYTIDKVGYVYYSRDKIQILPSRIYKEVLKVDLKVAIKEALKNYKGCTIYKEAGRYYIEVFKTL